MALLKLKVRLPPSSATRQTYEALWRQATWVRDRVRVKVRTYEALWRPNPNPNHSPSPSPSPSPTPNLDRSGLDLVLEIGLQREGRLDAPGDMAEIWRRYRGDTAEI